MKEKQRVEPLVAIERKGARASTAYKELARYYDLIYPYKNYKKEAEDISDLISKYKRSEGDTLLDVACGTGKHLEYFQNEFSCTGIDLNQEMRYCRIFGCIVNLSHSAGIRKLG